MENLLDQKLVGDYYDKSYKWHDLFYIEKESLGIHYGFWEDDVKTKSAALIKQYEKIAELLRPQSEDLILDAGCGVGGASLWFANNFGSSMIGITNSYKHKDSAGRYLRKRNLEGKVKYYHMDYFKTDFEDNTFDKAFGIESFCYSYPKEYNLFKEIYRILKNSGKFVMADGILLRKPVNKKEEKLADNFIKGFKMFGWSTREKVIGSLNRAGFKNIKFIDKTNVINKTVKELYKIGILTIPLHILRFIGLVSKEEADNFLAVIAQKNMYDIGLFGYGLFYAEK